MNKEYNIKELLDSIDFNKNKLTKGINKKTFQNIIGSSLYNYINIPHLTELKQLKLLTENSEYLSVTSQGLLVLNTIIEQLCL